VKVPAGLILAGLLIVIGVVVMLTYFDIGNRSLGAGLIAAGLMVSVAPAHADQALTVEDNAAVDCIASSKDLTRISLVGDEFASVSKVAVVSPLEDFNIVNEPTRGDIYVGVAGQFKRKTFSFFGTSKRGFVYKFTCRLEAIDAQQIFITNPHVAALAQGEKPGSGANADYAEAPDQDETAIRLVQGMASGAVVPGFRMERAGLLPVRSGDLSVQLVSEYQGLDLTGRIVRIENLGSKPALLSEAMVAPKGAVAVSIANARLASRQATSVYVVTPRRSGQP
jgi:conjugal transfer pilus assembly protein TraK